MKLSIDSLRTCDSFNLFLQDFSKYLRGGASFARRLDSQAFWGGAGPLQKAAQLERGLQDGLHPPLGEGLAMPHEFQQAQFPFCLQPPRCPHLRAACIIEHHAEHAPIQITYGRVFLFCLRRGSRESTLPGLQNALYWPAQRVHIDDRFRLPYGVRHVGNTEVPGQPFQVRLGRRIALFLRMFPGSSSTFIDDCLRHTHGRETRGDAFFCPNGDGFLSERDLRLDGGEASCQVHRTPMTGKRFREVGLMLEATDKIRSSRRHACQGFDRKIASINDEQNLFIRSGDDLIARALIWNVPWCQRDMTQHTTFLVPYGLNLGACCGRTPASTGKRLVELFRKFKAGAVSGIAFRKGGKPPSITPMFEGVDGGQGLTDHLLQKSHGLLVHALMNGFRRHG
jgi:hypothetical protein